MLAEDEYEFADALRHHRPRDVVLFEDNFNFLSKMCLARMREAAITMVDMAKAGRLPRRVAGADVTDHPDVYLARRRRRVPARRGRAHGGARSSPLAGVAASPRLRRASPARDVSRGGVVCIDGRGRSSVIPTSSVCPAATSSTSRHTADAGSIARPVLAEHGHHPRLPVLTATGAPSRSGASATRCARPPTWPTS